MNDIIEFEASRVIGAPTHDVWEVVADLDGYASHVSGLSETTVIEGREQGARRRCVDASGASWQETCVVWEPDSRYVVDVDVATYPWKFRSVFRAFSGTWSVVPEPDGSRVTICFRATPRRFPGVAALVRRAVPAVERDLDRILTSYESAVLTKAG